MSYSEHKEGGGGGGGECQEVDVKNNKKRKSDGGGGGGGSGEPFAKASKSIDGTRIQPKGVGRAGVVYVPVQQFRPTIQYDEFWELSFNGYNNAEDTVKDFKQYDISLTGGRVLTGSATGYFIDGVVTVTCPAKINALHITVNLPPHAGSAKLMCKIETKLCDGSSFVESKSSDTFICIAIRPEKGKHIDSVRLSGSAMRITSLTAFSKSDDEPKQPTDKPAQTKAIYCWSCVYVFAAKLCTSLLQSNAVLNAMCVCLTCCLGNVHTRTRKRPSCAICAERRKRRWVKSLQRQQSRFWVKRLRPLLKTTTMVKMSSCMRKRHLHLHPRPRPRQPQHHPQRLQPLKQRQHQPQRQRPPKRWWCRPRRV